jgi:TorA maturation chaperone TorD
LTAVAEGLTGGWSQTSEEDVLRGGVYRLLAQHLSVPPTTDSLASAAALSSDGSSPFGRAVAALSRVAGRVEVVAARREYQDLFIGLGRGELVPYASYYLTGFLQEKPLARLRQDMARLGIERHDGVSDPEDHIASILEMMAGLVEGRFGRPGDLDAQRTFYRTHVAPWMPVFFRDLEGAKSSVFYSTVGGVGRAFLDVEDAAFDMS